MSAETIEKKPGEEKGSISVHTENLFPIIKKWLYSEHDIFLRELVSNAVDAITKLNRLAGVGEFKGDPGKPLINIAISKTGKTVTISDNGVGMTRDEIKKYINQIAFSGAQEFVEKFKGSDGAQIIGHFGMGFFSSFMVSERVEIHTKSWQDAPSVRWDCDGSTEFILTEGTRKERGTDIILHINSESEDFLNEEKIKELITRYSNFLPVEIQVNGKKANEEKALWNEAPAKLKDEDYKEFYKKLFPFEEEPLFWIHFSVDYPFNLKGLLYFPKIRNDLEVKTKGRVKLFSNNVFVSDNIVDIIPPYLNLLQGVIDSPDIPLNVSRSFLQADGNVKKIGSHIVGKIADKLNGLYKNERENYVKFWDDIHPFIKFGCVSDDKFYDKVKDALLFKTTKGEALTFKEYQEKNPTLKDRVIYASDKEAQFSYIEQVNAKNASVVLLDSPIDQHFIQSLEMKILPTRFLRVDSDTAEALVTEKKQDDKETVDEAVVGLFKRELGKDKLEIKTRAFEDATLPATIIQSEHMRRFSDMSSMMQGKFDSSLLEDHTLVVNTANRLVTRIKLWATMPEKAEAVKLLCRNIYDLALLQQGGLKGEALADFVKRTSGLLESGLG